MRKQYYIFAACFLFSLGTNILSLSLIFRLTDTLSFNPGQIGTYMALGQLFYFLGCNLYHRIGSAFNNASVFTGSAIIVLISSIFLGFTRSSGIIYASYWILQIGAGFFWPPIMAWLTEGLSGKELSREMGFFNRSWMGANMIGPLIAGTLYAWNSTVNFLIIIFCYALVLALIILLRKSSGKEGTQTPVKTKAEDRDNTAENITSYMLTDKIQKLYRYRGWLSGFCNTVFVGVLLNIIPLHIRDGLGYTEQSAGIVLFMRTIPGLIGFSLLAKFNAWQFNRKWFYLTQSGLIACSVLLLLAGDRLAVFYAIVILYGFVNSACYNNSMFYSSATGISPKKNLAIHEIFLCMGNAAGTAGGGFMYQHFGFTGVCLSLVMALGMGLAAHFIFNRQHLAEVKKERTAKPPL